MRYFSLILTTKNFLINNSNTMLKKTLIAASLFQAVAFFSQQFGGMWIPTEINEKEMKSLGMKINATDIWSTQKPSIKDAVVQFNRGCTGEIISPKGLLLTNHHCGYSAIQSHSTVDNDLLSNGFWAKDNKGELTNPGMVVDFVTDIKDITKEILGNTTGLTDKELNKKIEENIDNYRKSQKLEDYQSILVRPMFAGNKYYAFTVETFKDIRLVGAPPQSIGKFGSDTDNWVWPRHTGDFSIFRVYANKNNKPADYSPDNIPFTPKHYLPISVKDIKENDFTFVFGFPGRTNEYLPSIAIEKIITDTNPARIEVRDIALKTLDEKMRADDATRIKYASKYASVANYWKKWIGETKGLKKSNAVAKKQQYENSLISKNPEIKNSLSEFSTLYNQQAPYALNNAYYTEILRNAETLTLANQFYSFIQAYEAGKTDEKSVNSFKNRLSAFYKDYDGELDAKVTAKLLALYANKTQPEFLPKGFEQFKEVNQNLQILENWSRNSVISGRNSVNGATMYSDINKVFSNLPELVKTVKTDPIFQTLTQMKETYLSKADDEFMTLQDKIDALQKKYLAQMMAADKDRKFFPDANSTLRVTYGKVKGSNPADAITYHYETTLDGVMEKYVPGDYEFDVPKKLIELYNAKDYGNYKNSAGKIPLAFTATNHTTGGNSGSPALDANGNLVGLNFDRQWEGTMSDINYDPRFSRNIMVQTKYILFIIDKFAGAKWLLDEMKIVK